MAFNPDPSKQAAEVIFSPIAQSPITFSGTHVASTSSQKYLGMTLDIKLTFNHHLKEKFAKANKGIGVIRKLFRFLPRSTLLNIYKLCVRPHLDYGHLIYDFPGNSLFSSKIESIQYNATLAITGTIPGTSMI